jgi:hypothetical protein
MCARRLQQRRVDVGATSAASGFKLPHTQHLQRTRASVWHSHLLPSRHAVPALGAETREAAHTAARHEQVTEATVLTVAHAAHGCATCTTALTLQELAAPALDVAKEAVAAMQSRARISCTVFDWRVKGCRRLSLCSRQRRYRGDRRCVWRGAVDHNCLVLHCRCRPCEHLPESEQPRHIKTVLSTAVRNLPATP